MIYFCIAFLPAVFLISRLLESPDLKLYKDLGIFTKIRIFLFQPKCHYCGQIACYEKINIHNYCTNPECYQKSSNWTHNMSYCSHRINTLGWKYNKEAILKTNEKSNTKSN